MFHGEARVGQGEGGTLSRFRYPSLEHLELHRSGRVRPIPKGPFFHASQDQDRERLSCPSFTGKPAARPGPRCHFGHGFAWPGEQITLMVRHGFFRREAGGEVP